GLKEPRFLENYPLRSAERARLEMRLVEPTLPDAFYALLNRRGFALPADDRLKRVEELRRIYEDADRHYDLFLLAESLIEYDEAFLLWRLRHVKMVERMIGTKTGTGGSEGAAYLRQTLDRKFFPDLWELR